jgi:arylsulfatase A-like enzyme
MVEAVDESTGRIVAALQQHGLTENTLVVFTSDNGGYLTYQGGYHNISSNGPLRGQKTDVYEGGHRVPAIVRWPGRIRPGISDQTAMTFDLFPAFAQLAGASGRAASLKLDGSNLNPVLFDGKPLAARTLFWRMRDKKAVRQGDWKLVLAGKQEPELYNLRSDIGESRNLADSQPEMKSKLLRELARWEADVDGSR